MDSCFLKDSVTICPHFFGSEDVFGFVGCGFAATWTGCDTGRVGCARSIFISTFANSISSFAVSVRLTSSFAIGLSASSIGFDNSEADFVISTGLDSNFGLLSASRLGSVLESKLLDASSF